MVEPYCKTIVKGDSENLIWGNHIIGGEIHKHLKINDYVMFPWICLESQENHVREKESIK